MGRWWPVVAVVVALMVLPVSLPTPVAAHANLVAAVPGPGHTVGGEVSRIQLIFDEPVTDFGATVTGPNGPIPNVEIEQLGPQQLELRFDPLTDQGRYQVVYDFVSIDTDWVELSFGFTYDLSAPAPLPFSGPIPVWTEPSPWSRRLPVLLMATLAVVVVALAERLRRQRAALARRRQPTN